MEYVANLTFNNYGNKNQSNDTVTMELNDMLTTEVAPSINFNVSNNASIFYYVIGVCGILLNAYVILVVAMNKPMHKHLTNIYIVNQSLIDGLASTILIFTTVFQYDLNNEKFIMGNPADETLCRTWYTGWAVWAVMDASTYNIVALTYERYLAIVHPIWYKTKFAESKLMIGLSIAFVWFIGPAYNASFLITTSGISVSGTCYVYNYPGAWAQTVVGVTTFLFECFNPILLIVIGYSAIAWSLHKRSRISLQPPKNDGVGNPNNKDKANWTMAKARSNVLKTSVLIALCFIISWTPDEIFYLAYNLNASCCTNLHSWFIYIISRAAVLVNCCANPIIYSLTYKEFKKGVVSLFTRMKKSISVGQTKTAAR